MCFFSRESLLYLLVAAIAVLAARVDGQQFHVRHVEFKRLVIAVEGGQPPSAGKALVVHYSQNPPDGALMFKEDGQKIVTVDGGLCIIDDDGVKLAQPTQGVTCCRFLRVNNRVKGIVCGTDEATMTIVAFGNRNAVMKHQDDPLITLQYSSNKNKFAAYFVPKNV